jgi:hypothetical protein
LRRGTTIWIKLKPCSNLLYARYDWGNGDFEEAIEGAGHVGNKEIANYLIEQGARVNLFVLTMLGKTNLVKPVLDEYPPLIPFSPAASATHSLETSTLRLMALSLTGELR